VNTWRAAYALREINFIGNIDPRTNASAEFQRL